MFGLLGHPALESAETLAYTGIADIGHYLLANGAIAIFLCLGLGYLLGKVKIKSFTVGATVGTLLVGLLISFVLAPLGVFKIDGMVKSIFFTLFIFTIGYEVGPTFVRSLKKNGLQVIILSVFFAAIALVVCLGLFKIEGIKPGEAAGIVAGSLTQSAVLGTAAQTIKTSMTGAAQTQAMAQMPIAYAITYVFGTVGVIIFMKDIAPKLLGVDLKAATAKKIKDSGFHEQQGQSVVSTIKARSFEVGNDSSLVGRTVEALEADFGDSMSVEALWRSGKAIDKVYSQTIAAGDIITCVGDIDSMVSLEGDKLTETADATYQKIALASREIVLGHECKKSDLAHLAQMGIIISGATRQGTPLGAVSSYESSDCLSLAGPASALAKVAKSLGYAKDTGVETDISFMSLGIVVGLLIGALCFKANSIPITLGAGGGALVGGLIFGWYQDKHANYGFIPAATRWFLKSCGLNLFIAVVGLTAGSSFLAALEQMGVMVLLLGIVVTLVPHIASVLFGRYVLHMDPVDIIGGLCGAGTCTAALNGVIDETGSSVFAMGYTPGYAVGNILITILGPLMVSLLI